MTVFLVNGVDIGTVWNILPYHRTVDCGGKVGSIPALKREAFSLILRKVNLEVPQQVVHLLLSMLDTAH